MRLKQFIKKSAAGLTILSIVLAGYTIWDNNRFILVEQTIKIDRLPGEFEGFKILQVTDLHEKEFGSRQKKLIEAINKIDYDAIVFTGDMLDGEKSKNFDSFFRLIEGIKNKEHALYIKGNADPENYESDTVKPFQQHEFITGMEKRGVTLLESSYTVKRGGSDLHFIDFELSTVGNITDHIEAIDNRSFPETAVYKNHLNAYFDHQKKLLEDISFLDRSAPSDVLVALNHYPVVDKRIDTIKKTAGQVFRPYDLIIAGHYHGGQIRLPFIGALFVPEAWYDRNGFLPPQDRVKGLWEYKQTKQYVSAGLGSSDSIPLLKFRLFNTPEINLLTLTNGK